MDFSVSSYVSSFSWVQGNNHLILARLILLNSNPKSDHHHQISADLHSLYQSCAVQESISDMMNDFCSIPNYSIEDIEQNDISVLQFSSIYLKSNNRMLMNRML